MTPDRSSGAIYRGMVIACSSRWMKMTALDRVSGGRLSADLILVNLIGKAPEESLIVGQHIREYGEFKAGTPLVIMAEKYGEDLEGTDVQVSDADWITYPEDHEQLQRLLGGLTANGFAYQSE